MIGANAGADDSMMMMMMMRRVPPLPPPTTQICPVTLSDVGEMNIVGGGDAAT